MVYFRANIYNDLKVLKTKMKLRQQQKRKIQKKEKEEKKNIIGATNNGRDVTRSIQFALHSTFTHIHKKKKKYLISSVNLVNELKNKVVALASLHQGR